jgi:hypothetical protein
MIGDSETMRRMGTGREVDKETEEFMNELEAPRQMMNEKGLDEKTQGLVDDLVKTLKKD